MTARPSWWRRFVSFTGTVLGTGLTIIGIILLGILGIFVGYAAVGIIAVIVVAFFIHQLVDEMLRRNR